MAETIQHILEVKGEIRMYHRLLMFLQTMLKNKCNKKATQSLLKLMLNNRDFFMGLMDGKENNFLWQNIDTGEFVIKDSKKLKPIESVSELKSRKNKNE